MQNTQSIKKMFLLPSDLYEKIINKNICFFSLFGEKSRTRPYAEYASTIYGEFMQDNELLLCARRCGVVPSFPLRGF